MGASQVEGRGLNSYQKSALAIALRHLEKALDSIAGLLAGDRHGILYHTLTDLSVDQRAAVQGQLAILRGEIAATATAFGLQAAKEDGRRAIIALLSSAWEGLEDVRSPKLRRFGAVDPTLRDSLDPRVERLIRLTLELEGLLAKRHDGQSD